MRSCAELRAELGARIMRRAGNRLQLQGRPGGVCQPQPDGRTHATGASLVTGQREIYVLRSELTGVAEQGKGVNTAVQASNHSRCICSY